MASARRAFNDGRWSRKPPAVRKKIMQRFAEKILAAKDELALLETLDMGKPIRHSLAVDVPSAARCIAWYAEAVDKVVQNLAETHPTIFPSVPRVFEKVFASVQAGALGAPGLKGTLARWAFPLALIGVGVAVLGWSRRRR